MRRNGKCQCFLVKNNFNGHGRKTACSMNESVTSLHFLFLWVTQDLPSDFSYFDEILELDEKQKMKSFCVQTEFPLCRQSSVSSSLLCSCKEHDRVLGLLLLIEFRFQRHVSLYNSFWRFSWNFSKIFFLYFFFTLFTRSQKHLLILSTIFLKDTLRSAETKSIAIRKLSESFSSPGPTEYCHREVFNATCESDEVMVMQTARYGRMSLGRCIRIDLGYLGCAVDVLKVMDAKCSGRSSCLLNVDDDVLYRTHPCPADITPHLQASYSCVKGRFLFFVRFLQLTKYVRNIPRDLLNILSRARSTREGYLTSRGEYSTYSTRYFWHQTR